ncbi:MAG: hypothetical protein PHZ25_01015 [Candidatus Pacebacteria bacterium]|nr:hypothetical protein [Candidatus Paceibacterota bacterium]
MVSFYFSLSVLLILFLVQIFKRDASFRASRFFFFFSIFFLLLLRIYLVFAQYKVWKTNPLTEKFLPPFNNWSYLIEFSLTRFFAPFFVSLVSSLLLVFLLKKINKKSQERLFYPEEPFLAGSSLLLSGYPGLIFFVIFLFFSQLFISIIFYLIFKLRLSSELKEPPRIPFLFLWVPSAFFVIIISNWLEGMEIWKLLQFTSFNF